MIRRYSILYSLVSIITILHTIPTTAEPIAHIKELALPIAPTANSMCHFFKTQFAQSSYTESLLPYHQGHLVQLLDFSSFAQHPISYATTIMRMFSQRIHTCTHMDATVIWGTLRKIRPSLQLLHRTSAKNSTRISIEEILFQKMNNFLHEHLAKSNPFQDHYQRTAKHIDRLCNECADAITSLIDSQQKESVEKAELQQATLQLLNAVLSKIMFDNVPSMEGWRLVDAIAQELIIYWQEGIILQEQQLNDLIWVLLSRYTYCMYLFQDEVEESLLLNIQQQLQSPMVTLQNGWLYIPECDSLMIPKAHYLRQVIFEIGLHKTMLAAEINDKKSIKPAAIPIAEIINQSA